MQDIRKNAVFWNVASCFLVDCFGGRNTAFKFKVEKEKLIFTAVKTSISNNVY
jgi:hypothetical protein